MKHWTIILTLAMASCTGDPRMAGYETHDQHQQLIGWTKEFAMHDGEHATRYYTHHEAFIAPYFSTDYKTDTLIARTLIEMNSCAETVAHIRISNDTLYLCAKQVSDEACASVTFNKVTYLIHNPGNKRYVVVSEQ